MAVKRKEPAGIEFTLLENGLDFVLSAVEHLGGDPSKRALKYAILHLYSGTLLILKERLFHEDWTLLFANPEKADEKRLESGDFTGPNLEQCLERLEEIDVGVADGQKTQLRLLGSKRKRLGGEKCTGSHFPPLNPRCRRARGSTFGFRQPARADRGISRRAGRKQGRCSLAWVQRPKNSAIPEPRARALRLQRGSGRRQRKTLRGWSPRSETLRAHAPRFDSGR